MSIQTDTKKKLTIEIVKQLITLSTAGFGVVAALAWNSVIEELVSTWIKPYFPAQYGIISRIVYAIIMTAIAVTVTYQLTKFIDKLEKKK